MAGRFVAGIGIGFVSAIIILYMVSNLFFVEMCFWIKTVLSGNIKVFRIYSSGNMSLILLAQQIIHNFHTHSRLRKLT